MLLFLLGALAKPLSFLTGPNPNAGNPTLVF